MKNEEWWRDQACRLEKERDELQAKIDRYEAFYKLNKKPLFLQIKDLTAEVTRLESEIYTMKSTPQDTIIHDQTLRIMKLKAEVTRLNDVNEKLGLIVEKRAHYNYETDINQLETKVADLTAQLGTYNEMKMDYDQMTFLNESLRSQNEGLRNCQNCAHLIENYDGFDECYEEGCNNKEKWELKEEK